MDAIKSIIDQSSTTSGPSIEIDSDDEAMYKLEHRGESLRIGIELELLVKPQSSAWDFKSYSGSDLLRHIAHLYNKGLPIGQQGMIFETIDYDKDDLWTKWSVKKDNSISPSVPSEGKQYQATTVE